jgi:5-methyltetrahydropteroyltriglutamate--homocysteine methyltransferase
LGRDRQLFREFYEAYDRATGSAAGYPVVCTGPIAYQGQTAVQSDIETFKAALAGVNPEEAFIPAVAPGTIELQRRNEYYQTDEAYLFAIADAMREEYQAIVDAGFLLQIDDPRVVPGMGCLTLPPALRHTGSLPSSGLRPSITH